MVNYDEKTGIRYGVISPHSINQFALDDIYTNGDDPYYENMRTEVSLSVDNLMNDTDYVIPDDLKEEIKDMILDRLSDGYENPDGAMDYSDNEYTLHVSGDNFGIFVMKSPYYTYCRGCSPCAPGAGDLDAPVDIDTTVDTKDYVRYIDQFGTVHKIAEKTLCLGPEWFDKEDQPYSRKIPYRVFKVDDDQEVI